MSEAPGTPPSASQPDTSFRFTFITCLVGAGAFMFVGLQLASLRPASPALGQAYCLAGGALLAQAYVMRSQRGVPGWLAALSARARLQPTQILFLGMAPLLAASAHWFAGISIQMFSPALAWAAWLAALALVVGGSLRAEPAAKPWPAWDRRESGPLVLLFVAALAVRLYENDAIPASLTGDEGSAALAAVDWLAGRMTNPFAAGWYSFPSLYFALPAMSIAAFGNTYAALRLPSALAGALTVVGLYWMARPMFGRLAAGLGAVLLASLHFHIHFSRIGLNNVWDGFFMVAGLGLFWRGWISGRRSYFIGAGLLIGLSQYFYTSARLIPVVILAWLAATSLVDRQRLRRQLADLAHMLLIAGVVCLPLLLFYVALPGEFSAPMERVSLFAKDRLLQMSAEQGVAPAQILLANFKDAALAFTTVPLRAWYNTGRPLLLAGPAAYFAIGVALALFNWRDARYWLVLLWLLGQAGIAAITESTPAGQRYVLGAPAATLLAGVALATMARWTLDAWQRGKWVVYGAAVLVVAASAGADLANYFFDYIPKYGAGDVNTQVASRLARTLTDYPAGGQVYFFGPPRMAYVGFSTMAFMAPQVQGIDVYEALTAEPDWALPEARVGFVFLPERAAELTWVQARFPGGSRQWYYGSDGERLFLLYELACSPKSPCYNPR